jgi:hypothetical protein
MDSNTPPKPNRQKRRVHDAQEKRKVPAPVVSDKARIHQLEVVIEGLRLAFNKNHAAYAHAIGAMDGHIAVMRATLNDVQRDAHTVRQAVLKALSEGATTPIQIPTETACTPDGSIAWETYYGWYNQHLEQQHAEEAAATAAESPDDKSSLVVDSTTTHEEIFGGEYGSGNRQVSEGSAHANSAPG